MGQGFLCELFGVTGITLKPAAEGISQGSKRNHIGSHCPLEARKRQEGLAPLKSGKRALLMWPLGIDLVPSMPKVAECTQLVPRKRWSFG